MNSLKISSKLKLLILLPILGLIFTGYTLTNDRYKSYKEYKMLDSAVLLSTKITSLIHELQKERGMTAGFLSSKGAKFSSNLLNQKELTNKKKEQFINFLKTLNLNGKRAKYLALLNKVTIQLNNLETIREQVSSFNIKSSKAINYYTSLNGNFLNLVRAGTSFSSNTKISKEINAYTNFLLAKERAGIERAVGAIIFSTKDLSLKLKFHRLISEQKAYLNSFEELATEDILSFYKNTLNNEQVKEVEKLRELILQAQTNDWTMESFHWFETITKKINLLKKIDDKIAEDLTLKADILASNTKTEMLFYLTINLLILGTTLAFGRMVSENILQGIRALSTGLENFFSFLNKESLEAKPIELKREDAVGVMAKKINENISKTKELIEDDIKFLKEIKEIVSMIKQGYLYQRLEYQPKNKNLEELQVEINIMLETMNKTIGGSVNKITDVLNSYTHLDFTNNIKNAQGEVEVAILNVGEMITKMLKENKQNGLTIENSSDKLLTNVDSLNTSSNETAASLEETAAALEEITSSISQNSENVVKMSTHANKVTTSVKNGEQLAKETTKAMDEINTQVSSINEAITVIDLIAFQTNILSLNAAVEAATAGEAGKGFAVVAGEVRNLAARSAEAAKEIKHLVENATLKANDGKDIADEMIKDYNLLNQSILETSELINDVKTASQEQRNGIEQINNAVTMLDQQTQKNASIAANTAKIAKETKKIATYIVEDVNRKKF